MGNVIVVLEEGLKESKPCRLVKKVGREWGRGGGG